MTITRRFQVGAELQNIAMELVATRTAATSNTTAKTGSYSFRFSSTDTAAAPITETSQLRVGFHWRHHGAIWVGNGHLSIVSWQNGTTGVGYIVYDKDGTVDIFVGGSSVASVSAASIGLTALDAWKHIGIDVKMHAVTGWVALYVDGIEVLSFSGDTLGATGETTIDQVVWGGRVTGDNSAWANFFYFDDARGDDMTGETAYAAVPDMRLIPITDNDNGTNSQMTGSDGDQTNNYQMCDEVPHDSDTTYVKALTPGLTDTYAMTTIAIPEDWAVAAMIGIDTARKGSAADDVKVSVTLQSGVTLTVGDAQAVGTSYGAYWQRWATDPNTGVAWTQGGIDAVEIGATSAGTYA